jgi:predicted GNAT family N-acyltransferase
VINTHIAEVNWANAQEQLRSIREQVFIIEQKVPSDLEWDGLDEQSYHLLAYAENDSPIGTARMLLDGHIGRMAVLVNHRNQGVGSELLFGLLDIARRHYINKVYLHSQLQAVEFYRRHNFEIISEEFMDAGIPHVTMQRQTNSQGDHSNVK